MIKCNIDRSEGAVPADGNQQLRCSAAGMRRNEDVKTGHNSPSTQCLSLVSALIAGKVAKVSEGMCGNLVSPTVKKEEADANESCTGAIILLPSGQRMEKLDGILSAAGGLNDDDKKSGMGAGKNRIGWTQMN